MTARAGLPNEDMEFVQFHPTGIEFFLRFYKNLPFIIHKSEAILGTAFCLSVDLIYKKS
jgi:succinate dehydrogenase/fumarate reductase flavoprotein subunit